MTEESPGFEVKEVVMTSDDLDGIVTDPEKLKTLLVQILQNLTVLNYVVAQLAEAMTLDIEEAKKAAVKNEGTGLYL